MITRPLQHLQAMAKHRPEGYVDDVIAGATVNHQAGTYSVSEERWKELVTKYHRTGPTPRTQLPLTPCNCRRKK